MARSLEDVLPPRRELQRALHERDADYDGVFYTAVKTTRVFCRPSCRARRPRPENVEFFASAGEAIAAGYRACKRCHPLAVGEPPPLVARLVAAVADTPGCRFTAADLVAMGVEPARARRAFRRHLGISFHAFCRGVRLRDALDELRRGVAIDEAVFESGYESHSGFRAAFARLFGATPGRAERATPVTVTWLSTPLGPMIAGADERGLCLLEYADPRAKGPQLAALGLRHRRALVPGEDGCLAQLREELQRYFAGELRRFSVPLALVGSPFQERVWSELVAIPYGETCSYEAIAARVGHPGAARAVGSANGRNPVAIVVPCHRVVNKDGALGGYGGGLWRKRRLLQLERSARSNRLPFALGSISPAAGDA